MVLNLCYYLHQVREVEYEKAHKFSLLNILTWWRRRVTIIRVRINNEITEAEVSKNLCK